jgi:DNA-binding CsgD family transcriptional regulator
VNGAILERDRELAGLAAAARDAARDDGSVVLVSGEAGIGKTSLVRAVRGVLPAGGRLLLGCCDDLATPRTLGPLRDLAGSVGRGLAAALEGALDGTDRAGLLDALRAELAGGGRPTVLAVEDVHWADEATLDALCFLVPRVADLPAVLLLTYRDELDRGHPLHRVLGHAARARRVRRLPLSRLSPRAVRRLAEGSPLDAGQLFAVTSGNPFFVTELLAAGDAGSVPPTTAEAVLARIRDLDRSAQELLELLAVVPAGLERWLLEALLAPTGGDAGGAVADLAVAEQRGLLEVTPYRVAFRHELTRRAIVDSSPAARRLEHNRRVLAALVGRPGVELSRIVHHAAEAGDADAIVRYGPDAAGAAPAAGSHRVAAAHYRLVLDRRDRFDPAGRAELLERYAVECYTLGNGDAAVLAQQEAVRLRRPLGDPNALGAALRWLSRVRWWAGDRAGAELAGEEAVAVLELAALAGTADRRLLALALSNQLQLHMLAGRTAEAAGLGDRAVAMAREVGDAAILSHVLNNAGSAGWDLDDPAGERALVESLRVALAADEVEHACRAYVNLAWTLIDRHRLAEAESYLAAGAELADRAEFVGFSRYLAVERAMVRLATGAWDEAVPLAELALDTQPPTECLALAVLGRVRARRGQSGADRLLDRAWDLAVPVDEAPRLGLVAAARAEAAWLAGDPAAAAAAAAAAYPQVSRLGTAAQRAELDYWLTRAGRPVSREGAGNSEEDGQPYRLQAAGRWREAAAAWLAAGYRYERAAALAESTEPEDLVTALVELDALGAEPLARRVRARLKELGASRIPRGPVRATRRNPAGLTTRQLQTVRLLRLGLSNAEIADRLVLSVRTVDKHVAAVLDKLGARTRQDAAARAAELGVLVDTE